MKFKALAHGRIWGPFDLKDYSDMLFEKNGCDYGSDTPGMGGARFQYIGIKDKNGAEIYEGNRLKYDNGFSWFIGIVTFMESCPGCVHDCGDVLGWWLVPEDGVYDYKSQFRQPWDEISSLEKEPIPLTSHESKNFELLGNSSMATPSTEKGGER